jgi:hypothetical protein
MGFVQVGGDGLRVALGVRESGQVQIEDSHHVSPLRCGVELEGVGSIPVLDGALPRCIGATTPHPSGLLLPLSHA